MDLFFEIHGCLPREAPGDDESTARAFSLLDGLPEKPAILDIGCGPGMQTFCLSRLTSGTITAVDNHRPFLDELDGRAARELLLDRVITREASMFDLDFEDGSFDLVWSECAVYVMGFGRGLFNWKRFLRPGGYIAMTEISWLKSNPPSAIRSFWKTAYPLMSSVRDNLAMIEELGLIPIGHFTLPETAWWNGYYLPLERRIAELTEKYSGDEEAEGILEGERAEIDMYRKYSGWYGCEFYIMRKPA